MEGQGQFRGDSTCGSTVTSPSYPIKESSSNSMNSPGMTTLCHFEVKPIQLERYFELVLV